MLKGMRYFLNLFNLFFFYFWLCWVFIAAHGLSLVVASGGYSLLPCTGFSLRWLLLLQNTGSRHTGFSSCGTWAQQLWCMDSVVVSHGLQSAGSVVVAHKFYFVPEIGKAQNIGFVPYKTRKPQAKVKGLGNQEILHFSLTWIKRGETWLVCCGIVLMTWFQIYETWSRMIAE